MSMKNVERTSALQKAIEENREHEQQPLPTKTKEEGADRHNSGHEHREGSTVDHQYKRGGTDITSNTKRANREQTPRGKTKPQESTPPSTEANTRSPAAIIVVVEEQVGGQSNESQDK